MNCHLSAHRSPSKPGEGRGVLGAGGVSKSKLQINDSQKLSLRWELLHLMSRSLKDTGLSS